MTMRASRLLWIVASLGALAGCTSDRGAERPAAKVESQSSPTSLEGTDWRLVELNGKRALGTEGPGRAGLEFQRGGGRVSGSTGCNRFSGSFTLDGAALRFAPLATTRMACIDEKINQQELAFLSALGATERYALAGDTLTLVGPSGNLARFVRGSPTR